MHNFNILYGLLIVFFLFKCHLVDGRSIRDLTVNNRTMCPQDPSNIPSVRVNTTAQLTSLRLEMTQAQLHAYITLSSDEHGAVGISGEEHDRRLKYLSGFSGSNGYSIVTSKEAAVWTDGRYFLQAEMELDCNWILMKQGEADYPAGPDWIVEMLDENSTVGAFPNYVPTSTWQTYESVLATKNIRLTPLSEDLVDKIWTENKPDRPNHPLFVHPLNFAGKTWKQKVADVRERLTEKKVDALVITDLDEVAWLYNLRGSDRTSSLFYSYSVLYKDKAVLYLKDFERIIADSTNLTDHLNILTNGTCQSSSDDCVEVREYSTIEDDLDDSCCAIWITPTSNYHIYRATATKHLIEKSPIQLMKAIKNPTEKGRFFKCIMRDSAAVVEFMALLEPEVNDGKMWTEVSASEKLTQIRSQYEYYRGTSFNTIAGVGSNAAIIHYRPSSATDKQITTNEIFLLDSGGQYLDGTTDITRTFHFGQPTDIEKEAYTRVLMGAIDLAQTVWPEGLYGSDIDVRARATLWQNGWDYNHGTGHGIGYYLSVHEGPASIRMGFNSNYERIYEGMFFSDEPGFYEDGSFGVRLETLVAVEKANTPNNFGGRAYLSFKAATLFPFEPKLIKYELLTYKQIQWLNDYHKRCEVEVGSYLKEVRNNIKAYEWLIARTQAVTSSSSLLTSFLTVIILAQALIVIFIV